MTSRMQVAFVIRHPNADDNVADVLTPWLTELMQRVATLAKSGANKDTGFMASSIDAAVAKSGERLIGVTFVVADYGIWQELEPGETIPVGSKGSTERLRDASGRFVTGGGAGARVRGGGKPFLRPALFKALRESGAKFV